MPDNSCSVSFYAAFAMVEAGAASFNVMSWGTSGAPIQASWTSRMNISGTLQDAIEAHIIAINDDGTALKVAKLIWGEQSGISVTSKTLSLS